jgi:hypothetical protein
MWDGWKINEDTENSKNFELMVNSGAQARKPNVLLVVSINRIDTSQVSWQAEILSFAPSAGEYSLYKDSFSSMEDAEREVWERAQKIVSGTNLLRSS